MKEIEREDRIGKARKKREEFQEGMKRREIQTRITENLKILPKNKQILLEKQVNKEMLMCLKEAKEEIWKKWRQRKGRGLKNPGGKLKEYTLEMKLARIEKETDKYKKELEEEEKRNKEKSDRLVKKRKKEEHWEMLRWVVAFIDEQKENWEETRREKLEERELAEQMEEWEKLSKTEKIEKLVKEEKQKQEKEEPERKKKSR